MSEREELLDETYTAESGWERAVLHLTLKVPQRLDSPDHDNGLGLIQEILDDASFDITVEPLDLAARDARIREDALREVAVALETKANDYGFGVTAQAYQAAARIARAVIDTPAQAETHEQCADPNCRQCWGPNLLDTHAQADGTVET